jgi:HK97 family phage major capsid protein
MTMKTAIELRQKRASLLEEAQAMVLVAEKENRDLNEAELAEYNGKLAEAEQMLKRAERLEAINGQVATLGQSMGPLAGQRSAPAVLTIPRGDSFEQGFSHWLRTGDGGGLERENMDGNGYTLRASNATDMNITTGADGGDLVPTGFYNQIIARRDESMLAAKLPIMRVPGVGTTVDVPLDNEADGEFVATSEAGTFDLDAPAVTKKSLTLALYSKYLDVSYQLLEDTPTNLLGFLADFVGRGMAKTHNSLLLTEVAANGTSLKTFASASAIAFGEPEDIVGNNDLGEYLSEDSAVAWVMRSATHWDLKSLTGSDRQYAINVDTGKSLLGYPVNYSQKAAAVAASAKSLFFGNWRYVGMREAPGITFIRDPFTVAVSGQVRLLWHFRTVYGVLQAEAVGYGVHPSA